MKAIIIGPAFPLRGGIADFNEALSKAMTKSSIQNKIFSFYYQYPKILFPGKTQYAESGDSDGIIVESSISSINPVSWIKTANKIIAEKPDLVIVRYWLPFMGPSLGTICRRIKKKGIPVIAITDNIVPHEKRPGDKWFTQYFVNSCDGFITMSKSVLEDLSKFTSTSKKKFTPHPVYSIFGDAISKSEARNLLNLKADEKVILFFGFIRQYKGLDLLLNAMSDARLRNAKIKLIVAGEFYEDKKPYLNLIEKLQIGKNVIINNDFIPKEEVAHYFCAADLVVQPYRSATQSGITQIAYHFGRPMIVTKVGGLSEIVEDGKTGYLVNADPAEIATAIDNYYQHNREKEMSAEVIKGSVRFSWDYFIKGIMELYAEIH